MSREPRWLLVRACELPPGLDWLTPAERDRLAALRVQKRRRDWLLGRWAAKRAVALAGSPARAGQPLALLEIRATETGAPAPFERGTRLAIQLSISHRAGAALAAVSLRGPVGCDLELIEPRSAAFLADYLTATERELVERAAGQRDLVANGIWSAKESVLKLRQTGLRSDTRALALDAASAPLGSDWRAFAVRLAGEAGLVPGWWRRVDEWVLTVATEESTGPPIRLDPISG